MSENLPKPEDLGKVNYTPPDKGWLDNIAKPAVGNVCHAAKPGALEYLGMPYAREWRPLDDDWHLPENWHEIISDGIEERLGKFRSFKLFMDICVRCGACADKCHFFIGSGDPKNMPVLRAELLRSVYRHDHSDMGKLFGKHLGKLAGGRPLTLETLKEWFIYFYQCTECRRCSVFCPYGIDTAEITMMGRELLNLVGANTDWIHTPVSNCFRVGNHLGIEPHTFKDTLEFFADEVEDIVGFQPKLPINKKGAEILFVTPSGDYFADPGTYTLMGYLMLFHELDLDYTWSTYASEGGNFGLFSSNENMKRLNGKIYAEAKRLGVKWILGGECGHMWRVIHQYQDTMNGELKSKQLMDVPTSPITGTRFENARSSKIVHIAEFTADLIKHNKLKLDKSRNDKYRVTFHDSCNPARGMGLLDEPRYIQENVCNNFWDMPENTIREQTFCCGAGSGLNTDEILEIRMQGGLPRANAVGHVKEKYGVNTLSCVCAIDRATLSELMEYWHPDVGVCGVHELVANALVMKGEKERETDLRGEDLKPEEDE